jgi:hypothetical protein
MYLFLSLSLVLLAAVVRTFGKYNERYDEPLKLKSLHDRHLLALFDFRTIFHNMVPREPVKLETQDDHM